MSARRNRARNQKIIAMNGRGTSPREIAVQLRLTRGVVSGVLHRARITPRSRPGCPRSADPAPSTYRCGDGHCWHESLARRLEWQGGPSANAAADLAAWRGLGARREVAA